MARLKPTSPCANIRNAISGLPYAECGGLMLCRSLGAAGQTRGWSALPGDTVILIGRSGVAMQLQPTGDDRWRETASVPAHNFTIRRKTCQATPYTPGWCGHGIDGRHDVSAASLRLAVCIVVAPAAGLDRAISEPGARAQALATLIIKDIPVKITTPPPIIRVANNNPDVFDSPARRRLPGRRRLRELWHGLRYRTEADEHLVVGIELLIASSSTPYLQGVTLDFVEMSQATCASFLSPYSEPESSRRYCLPVNRELPAHFSTCATATAWWWAARTATQGRTLLRAGARVDVAAPELLKASGACHIPTI
jgi:hypothetical protein